MTGTIINIGTVLIGGLIGLLVGARFSDRVRDTVISVLGLFTLAVGILTFLDGVNVEGERILIPLVSLLIGGRGAPARPGGHFGEKIRWR